MNKILKDIKNGDVVYRFWVGYASGTVYIDTLLVEDIVDKRGILTFHFYLKESTYPYNDTKYVTESINCEDINNTVAKTIRDLTHEIYLVTDKNLFPEVHFRLKGSHLKWWNSRKRYAYLCRISTQNIKIKAL